VAHGATSEGAPVPRLGRTTIERRPEPRPVKQRSRSHVEEAAQAGYWANGGNESVSPVPQHTEICPLLREEAVRAHS
jgi:hypothetical protein